jgi:hypothetical protein
VDALGAPATASAPMPLGTKVLIAVGVFATIGGALWIFDPERRAVRARERNRRKPPEKGVYVAYYHRGGDGKVKRYASHRFPSESAARSWIRDEITPYEADNIAAGDVAARPKIFYR